MKKNLKVSFFWLMAIIFVYSIFAIENFAQVQSKSKKTEKSDVVGKLPGGNWSISINPYQEDYFSPVFLYSVSSNQARAERFDIQNISDKPIKAIKVSWLVYQDEDRSKTLKQGITKLLQFRNELPSGQTGFIKFPVVAFAEFYKQFLANNRLDGHFDIDLRIEEVQFADGSVWQRQDGRSPDIKSELELQTTSLDCARQQCVGTPSGEIRGGVTYSCGASTLNQRCVVNGDYACTNQSCNSSGGGGIEIILD
ncbi:hypothetical protein BH20ACI4_BH20ACI4_13270 [soil metagenome]